MVLTSACPPPPRLTAVRSSRTAAPDLRHGPPVLVRAAPCASGPHLAIKQQRRHRGEPHSAPCTSDRSYSRSPACPSARSHAPPCSPCMPTTCTSALSGNAARPGFLALTWSPLVPGVHAPGGRRFAAGRLPTCIDICRACAPRCVDSPAACCLPLCLRVPGCSRWWLVVAWAARCVPSSLHVVSTSPCTQPGSSPPAPAPPRASSPASRQHSGQLSRC
jgi:hypothetical protein